MNNLVLAPTNETPRVDFNAKTGQLRLEGRSWPEDITLFYSPLIDWFTEYIANCQPETDFYVTLEYFSSATSKMIYDLFLILMKVVAKGSKVTVHWHYQYSDEEMLEAGKEYSAAINSSSDLFQFKFIGIDEYP